MIIPDSHVEHALKILQSGDHSRARGAYEWSEKQLKTVLAQEVLKSALKTVSERENEALASVAYVEALDAFKEIATAYFAARDRREAADAVLRTWQTASADNRAQGRIT